MIAPQNELLRLAFRPASTLWGFATSVRNALYDRGLARSTRLTVPVVRPAVTFDALLAAWPDERRILLCAESGDARPIFDAVSEIQRTGQADPTGADTRVQGTLVSGCYEWRRPRAFSRLPFGPLD